MKSDFKFKLGRRKKLTSLLGLTLDGSRLEGVVLKRTNGSLQLQQSFTVTLALDPLTAAPELVGREIRNHLDAAGVRERDCVLGVPLKWVLTAQTELPPLPEADVQSLLLLEAERSFHADVTTLQMADSRTPLAADKQSVLLAAIPQPHIATLEQVLAAARLKSASFALGLSALAGAAAKTSSGVLTLQIGESHVGLQIHCGGVTALRALEGAVENVSGRPVLQTDLVAREIRITLGQLPAELRARVQRICIYGPRDLAQQLADELELKLAAAGLPVEVISAYAPHAFGVTLPPGATVSAAFSLAARQLTGELPPFEFLPPKPNLVERFVAKYSSGRLRTTGAVAAVVVLIGLGIFMFQQVQLWNLRSQWSKLAGPVGQLEVIQADIRQYRPWYDGSFKSLAILRQLSLAFPEDGAVTAKNITIRDGSTVTCTGTARDIGALLAVEAKLSALPGVTAVHHEQSRGNKPPLQFTLSFKFKNGGAE